MKKYVYLTNFTQFIQSKQSCVVLLQYFIADMGFIPYIDG